jgi:hypothetical protein
MCPGPRTLLKLPRFPAIGAIATVWTASLDSNGAFASGEFDPRPEPVVETVCISEFET